MGSHICVGVYCANRVVAKRQQKWEMRLFTVGAAVFLQAVVHLGVADHQKNHLEVAAHLVEVQAVVFLAVVARQVAVRQAAAKVVYKVVARTVAVQRAVKAV